MTYYSDTKERENEPRIVAEEVFQCNENPVSYAEDPINRNSSQNLNPETYRSTVGMHTH